MDNTHKKLRRQIADVAEELKSLSNNDLIQAQNEYSEIEPLMSFLGIEYTQLKRRHGLPVDFELKFEGNTSLKI